MENGSIKIHPKDRGSTWQTSPRGLRPESDQSIGLATLKPHCGTLKVECCDVRRATKFLQYTNRPVIPNEVQMIS